MDSEQRRKRKRVISRPPLSSAVSVRSLLLCFSFLFFLYLLSYRIPIPIPIHSSSFRPVLVVSSLSLLSSSSSSSSSSGSLELGNLVLNLKVEDRVLFPDHVLLLVSKSINHRKQKIGTEVEQLECIYHDFSMYNDTSNSISSGFVGLRRDVLSVDEYDEFRFLVRCEPPIGNSSAVGVYVQTRRHGRSVVKLGISNAALWTSNLTFHSWENVAYAATLDGATAVVFVKGLNLRPNRESDASQFTCHFGLGNLEKDGRFVLTTRAITAAQEVVRCYLPRNIRKTPKKARGIRVTIGTKLNPHVHVEAREHVLIPSVARISGTNSMVEGKKKKRANYELCVCTMVWNQASAIREWITYHAWLGVQRWFVYDNNSDDGIKEVIEELELEGYNVSRHVWPWIKTQEAGFSHCALRARNECQWVSFMDVDEYFYFPFPTRLQRSSNLAFPRQNSLRSLVANFSSSRKIAEIRTACHSFGPSGLSSPPSQGVTAGYTCRLKNPERHKSIVRPDALDITLLNVVHHFHLKKGLRYLNLPQSTAVINHYKYQVWEVFRAKFFRRVATYVADWQDNQNEGSKDRAPGLGTEAIEPPNWRQQFCEIWDTGLRDFVLANMADPETGLLPWERSPL